MTDLPTKQSEADVDENTNVAVEKKSSTLMETLLEFASNIQFKLFAFILIIFIIISSDVFVNRVLSKIDGTVVGRDITLWGTFMQGLILVIISIILDIGIRFGLI